MPAEKPQRHLAAVPDVGQQIDDNGPMIEQIVLATAMDSLKEYNEITDVGVTRSSFTVPYNGMMWGVITAAVEANEPTSVIAITERLIKNGDIKRLPNQTYMFDVHQRAAPMQGAFWAKQLVERAAFRDAKTETIRLTQGLETPGVTLTQIAGYAERVAEAASRVGDGDDAPAHLADLAGVYIDTYMDWEEKSDLPTPWVDVNGILTSGGFERGQVVTFAGSTGMGKSIALLDCARHLGIDQGNQTIYFSMEMTKDQITCRALAAISGVPEVDIKSRRLTGRQIVRIDEVRNQVADSALWLMAGSYSVTQIANTVRKHRARYGDVAAIVVDYVQLLRPDGKAKENRQLEVSAFIQSLKRVALDENLLVLVAAQVNRGPAARADKRPMLSDLRECGELENSSDIVVLMYRDDYYDPKSPQAGEAEFNVAKQRGGPRGIVTLAAQLHFTRFVSMAQD